MDTGYIYGAKEWNVEVKRNCAPHFERNKIHHGHPGGVYCHGDGDEGYDGYCLPTLDHNEIYDNEGPGINVGPEAYVKATHARYVGVDGATGWDRYLDSHLGFKCDDGKQLDALTRPLKALGAH